MAKAIRLQERLQRISPRLAKFVGLFVPIAHHVAKHPTARAIQTEAMESVPLGASIRGTEPVRSHAPCQEDAELAGLGAVCAVPYLNVLPSMLSCLHAGIGTFLYFETAFISL